MLYYANLASEESEFPSEKPLSQTLTQFAKSDLCCRPKLPAKRFGWVPKGRAGLGLVVAPPSLPPIGRELGGRNGQAGGEGGGEQWYD